MSYQDPELARLRAQAQLIKAESDRRQLANARGNGPQPTSAYLNRPSVLDRVDRDITREELVEPYAGPGVHYRLKKGLEGVRAARGEGPPQPVPSPALIPMSRSQTARPTLRRAPLDEVQQHAEEDARIRALSAQANTSQPGGGRGIDPARQAYLQERLRQNLQARNSNPPTQEYEYQVDPFVRSRLAARLRRKRAEHSWGLEGQHSLGKGYEGSHPCRFTDRQAVRYGKSQQELQSVCAGTEE